MFSYLYTERYKSDKLDALFSRSHIDVRNFAFFIMALCR